MDIKKNTIENLKGDLLKQSLEVSTYLIFWI
jgi:hypothetical protein